MTSKPSLIDQDFVESLEFICNDNGDSAWYFDKDSEKYYRIYKNGNFIFISGKNIPDPETLVENRKRQALALGLDPNFVKQACDSTKSIYAHYQNYILNK